MEKISIVTTEKIITQRNVIGEVFHDYLGSIALSFEAGKVYGLICEHGGGGESIASILTGKTKCNDTQFSMDNSNVSQADLANYGWLVGNPQYSARPFCREMTVKQCLLKAIKSIHRYNSIDEVVADFHLSEKRLNLKISNCSWERWRASLAIGYAQRKKVFCFPWMNSLYFYDCFTNSAVHRCFSKLLEDDCIILLFTSKEENCARIADEIIDITPSRFMRTITVNGFQHH